MEKIKNYDISFDALKQGEYIFNYKIDQSFFDLFTFDQGFTNPEINVEAILAKHSSFMELMLNISGTLQLICDVSGEEYKQEVDNELKVLIKFGENYDDSGDDIIILPQGAYSVNIAQLVYEEVILSIPMKHISPEYLQDNGEEDFEDQDFEEEGYDKDSENDENSEDEDFEIKGGINKEEMNKGEEGGSKEKYLRLLKKYNQKI